MNIQQTEKTPSASVSAPNSPHEKDVSRGPRFFDLPIELRESIYEYVSASWPNQKIDLNEYSIRTIATEEGIVPPLLRAGRRFSLDAGGYFFIGREFDITMRLADIDTFAAFLGRIGEVNRTRLLSNSNVTIRLVHEQMICKNHCILLSRSDANTLTGARFVRLLNQHGLYQSIDTAVALALAKWAFINECPGIMCASLPWPNIVTIVGSGDSVEVFSRNEDIKHVGVPLLQRLLESIFAVHRKRKGHGAEEHKR